MTTQKPTTDSETWLPAPSDTLLGLLQRGRGLGHQLALKSPKREVHDALWNCVTDDPRYAPQAESRADYYAELILATGFDVSLLEHHLRAAEAEDDYTNQTRLALETLEALLRRQEPRALQLLEDYVGYGYNWPDAVELLAAVPDPNLWERVEPLLRDRCVGDVIQLWVEDVTVEPWAGWRRRNPLLGRYLADAESGASGSTSEIREPLASHSLEQLIDAWAARQRLALQVARERVVPKDEPMLLQIMDSDDEDRRAIAVHLLAKLGSPELARRLTELWIETQDGPTRLKMAVREAVRKLPGELLIDWGREWANDADPLRRRIAGTILAEHGDERDIPVLRWLLRDAVASDEWYRACCVEAFSRMPTSEAWPELDAVYTETWDSYVRLITVRAMIASDPDHFRSTYAAECLHDCEESTRDMARRALGVTV